MLQRIPLPAIVAICLLYGTVDQVFALKEGSAPVIGSAVDIARFAVVRTWKGPEIGYPRRVRLQRAEDIPRKGRVWTVRADTGESTVNIGLEWDEPRDVRLVSFVYADNVPDPAGRELQVWLNQDEGDENKPRPLVGGESPSQGRWYTLTPERGLSTEVKGRTWTYHLPAIEKGIFKLRLVVKGGTAIRLEEIRANTDARWRAAEFEVRFDPPRKVTSKTVEGCNAEVIGIASIAGCDGCEVRALASDAPSDCEDRAIFTVRAGDRSFSFLMNDLDADGEIHVKPFRVKVTKPTSASSTRLSSSQAVEPGAKPIRSTEKTITERVLGMSEQTLDSALKAILAKERNKWLALAPPLNPRKFAVHPNGDAFSRAEWDFLYQFATGDVPDYGRREPQRVEEDYLPILYADWEDGGLRWQQGYVVASLGKFDDPTSETALITKISARNEGRVPADAKLWLRLRKGNDKLDNLRLEDGIVFEGDRIRARLGGSAAADAGEWSIEPKADEFLFTVTVPVGETRSIEVEIPYPTIESPPARIGFDAARKQTIEYWRSKLPEGADFNVPDERVNRIWKSLLIHQYCWGDYDAKTGYYLPNVALAYGPVGNESSQMAKALDFFGHSKLARDYYEPMWRGQGTDELHARVTNGRGCLVGWWAHYVFNTGFILWNLGNHYCLTGDRAWLEQVIPNMVKACDWLDEQRRTTVGKDLSGRPVMESGFFPPCGLEDEGRWFYWVMTNGYFYLGMSTVAELLAEIGHPDAGRIADEAKAYLRDLRRGIGESIVRCPVVRLRDGSYVPHIPKYLHERERSKGHYEAELGALHLLTDGVCKPDSREMDWTLAFHEDVVYMTEAPGCDSIISPEDIERNWFHLGGYGKTQPYLAHTQFAYLRRDQPKLFLRSFWNQLAAQNFRDVNAFPEFPICWDGGADCKTYEESMWLQQFRSMLVLDEDGKLRLSVAPPREWFENGKTICVKNALTFFGPVSYEIRSEVKSGTIEARIEFAPRKTPKSFNIRFRHPSEAQMTRVTLDGEPWRRFDPAKEMIELPIQKQAFEVVAYY